MTATGELINREFADDASSRMRQSRAPTYWALRRVVAAATMRSKDRDTVDSGPMVQFRPCTALALRAFELGTARRAHY